MGLFGEVGQEFYIALWTELYVAEMWPKAEGQAKSQQGS